MTRQPQHRRSIRLPGYDYSQPGGYFVTISAYKKEHLFGAVTTDRVELNQLGTIVTQEWLLSAELRPEIELDEFVVMPNHLHAIVIFHDPAKAETGPINVGAHGRAPRRNADQLLVRAPRSLGSFIAGFKGAATARINAVRGTPGAPVWQRNYHEHIIRNTDELQRIRQYITDNPAKWADDPENA